MKKPSQTSPSKVIIIHRPPQTSRPVEKDAKNTPKENTPPPPPGQAEGEEAEEVSPQKKG